MKSLIAIVCMSLAMISCRSNPDTEVVSTRDFIQVPTVPFGMVDGRMSAMTTASFAEGELVFADNDFVGRVISSCHTTNGWMYQCHMSIMNANGTFAECTRYYHESKLFSFGREDE